MSGKVAKRKLDLNPVAITKKSKIVLSEPGRHDETTKFTWKRQIKLKTSKMGVTPSATKKKILKESAMRHLYDSLSSAPLAFTATGYKQYKEAFAFLDPDFAAGTHEVNHINLRYVMEMLSRIPEVEPTAASSSFVSSNPVYIDKIHVTKTWINASNIIADIWLSEVYSRSDIPRTDYGNTFADAINTLSDTAYNAANAAAGYNTTEYDISNDVNYALANVAGLPNYHWSMNREFTQKFKVTAEKHFSLPPGGKLVLDITFDVDDFISYKKYVDMGAVAPCFLPEYVIATRGELVLGGAVDSSDSPPTFGPIKLAQFVTYHVTGGAVNPSMFGNSVTAFGAQMLATVPSTTHKFTDRQTQILVVDPDV